MSARRVGLLAITMSIAYVGCVARPRTEGTGNLEVGTTNSSQAIAESYVKTVLALGAHDADYVDAYYGPAEWRAEVERAKTPLPEIRARAGALLAGVRALSASGDEMGRLRHAYLVKQLEALIARVDMLGGKRLTFDDESRALYDAVAPTFTEAHFQSILDQLGQVLPGEGSVAERYERFRSQFVIPREKVDAVFQRAIAECKRRTERHIALPPGESFRVEYVTGKSWSGYNWYQGNYRSLIQVNVDLPIFIDRAVDLACHEGYPGHHVYNALLEHHLVRGRGWQEFSVYPLFSPQSLIAEGSANYGIEMAFPGAERVRYEREVLFPLAGLDPSRAEEYYRVHALAQQLSYAGNEAARRYLNGEIDGPAAAAWLVRFAMYTPALAERRVRFMDQYRSYVINYNLGEDLVRRHIERMVGANATESARWQAFRELLSSPRVASTLR
jgi:hypothetical protein